MPYTPPAHNAVNFNFSSSYTPPAHYAVNLSFTPPPVNGTLTASLANVTAAIYESETYTGPLASTLANFTVSASGGETFSGPLGATLGATTANITASVSRRRRTVSINCT